MIRASCIPAGVKQLSKDIPALEVSCNIDWTAPFFESYSRVQLSESSLRGSHQTRASWLSLQDELSEVV